MKSVFTLLIAFSSILNGFSQCNGDSTKVIVFGDSWAFFSWTYNSFHENFDKYGFSDVKAYSDTGLSVLGAHADSYFYPAYRQTYLASVINSNPQAEIVHMSLGGNDFLTMWDNTMTLQQSDSVIQDIIYYIRRDVDTIHAINPNLTIYIPGYDFPNFVETAGLVGSSHPFYGVWTNMGQPSALELNSFVERYHQFFLDSIATWSKVEMVNNVGLMQWTYGQTSPMLVAPFASYAAMSVPLPGGNINYPSPRTAMGVGGTDSFHLKDGAYEVFLERMVRLFYWRKLRKADASVFADDTNSGTVYSDGTVSSTVVRVGNSTGLTAKGILSFNTASLDETLTIAKASIFLKKQTMAGANPIAANLLIGIKNGSYGSSDLLVGDEYSSASNAEDTACTYGTLLANNYWMRVDIPQSLLPHFNLTGTTQFQLEYLFADAGRNIDFFNSLDTNYQVVLDVVYGLPVGINERAETMNNFTIYPNPSKGKITISFDNNQSGKVELFSISGARILQKNIFEQKLIEIEVSKLPRALYFVKFSSENTVLTNRVVLIE